MVDFDKFRLSLRHLELQYENMCSLDSSQPPIIKEAVAESVIQRFEACYDCLWKVLKRYLNEELGLPELPNSPKPIFRIAHENRLIVSEIEQWLLYADARIGTAHDYIGEKAGEALAIMGRFISDSRTLYEKMSGNQWPN